MKLNCDLGESFSHWQLSSDADLDKKIMPHIDMANIACGFHASDPLTMAKTVKLAKQHHIIIGAHPGYPDLLGFGRRSMKMSIDELIATLHYQIGALQAISAAHDTQVSYVKPHGALYNDMMANHEIFTAVCKAIACLNASNTKNNSSSLSLVVQAIPDSEWLQTIAKQYHLTLQFEAFADRNYQDNGLLVPRSAPNALITDNQEIVQRCKKLLTSGKLFSINNQPLSLAVDTLCVHGDHPSAVELVSLLKPVLEQT